MSRVLLINPSYVPTYSGTKASIVNPVFPTLGPATIAATAKERGHQVRILDLSYTPYDFDDVRAAVLAFKPDIVGLTATTPLMNQLRDITVLIKDISENIRIVAGGPHPTALPTESIIESKLDVVFCGEADYAFADLCDGKELDKIGGLSYRNDDGEIKTTAPRLPIANLDELPMPAWELYDPEIYRKQASRLYVRTPPLAGIEFSRGCVFKCDFCASKMTMALGYRKKSPERCAEEMKKLESLGFREAWLADDIFTSDQSWATQVSEAMIDAGVKINWTCANGIRVESANQKLFQTMRRAGCYRVAFGFESGNDDVLKSFGKGGRATVEQGRRAVQQARQAGIDTCGYFMLGLSGDSEESMMDTIQYARELPLDMLKFARTIAFPGTAMFNAYHERGLIRSYDWDDYFIYSAETLATHEHLSEETIEYYTRIAYRKSILFNPRFIWRRLVRGFRTGEFFWDAWYALKLFMMPSLRRAIPVRYYAPERWPVYDFVREGVSAAHYQVVRKKPSRTESSQRGEPHLAQSGSVARAVD